MERGEEIRNAIDIIIPIKSSENGRTYEQALMATGFEAGVSWADETMIENACKWLIEQKEMIGISFQEDFIERFKMAMKK